MVLKMGGCDHKHKHNDKEKKRRIYLLEKPQQHFCCVQGPTGPTGPTGGGGTGGTFFFFVEGATFATGPPTSGPEIMTSGETLRIYSQIAKEELP